MSEIKSYEYTINMKTIFQGELSKLKSYYCREDIELALNDYDHAPKDSKKFRLKDLSRLCKARGIETKKLISNRSLLQTIPTREMMQEDLLQSFYEMYSKTPATDDIMERIVRRLAPQYNNDTVRVAILKKFVEGGEEHFKRFNTSSIIDWAKKKLNSVEVAEFETLTNEQKKVILLSKIDDSIFEQEFIQLTSIDILKIILDRIIKYREDENIQFQEIQLSKDSKSLLFEIYGIKYETNHQQLQNLYDCVLDGNISNDDQHFIDIVSRIEIDFRNQLKTIKRVSKTGIEGTMDDLYRQAKKDALKAKKAKANKTKIDQDLLNMCDDLAMGNFRGNGKTKVSLYYFAMMFHMIIPLEGRVYEPQRDVVKNLFQDYYNDNLLRLLTKDYKDSKKVKSLEMEPTGEGINYKNFVEMIYIYFLCREDLHMTPGEKIDTAESIINQCVERAKKEGQSITHHSGMHTEIYKELHINVLLNLNIDDIVDYIFKNYQVFSSDNIGKMKIMISSQENTASDLIEEIMDDLDNVYPDFELFGIDRRSDLSKEIKGDIAFRMDVGFDWKIKSLLEKRYAFDSKFIEVVNILDKRTHIHNGRFNRNDRCRMLMLLRILTLYTSKSNKLSTFKIQTRMEEKGIISVGYQLTNAMNTLIDLGFDIHKNDDSFYLGNRKYDDEILNDLLDQVQTHYYKIDDASELLMTEALIRRLKFDKRITRSELIAIHLNYYVALLNDTEGLDTFPDVFEDYEFSINQYLQEARYQPLSEKNIFDMYVVIALYFYLIENNGYM